MAKIRDMTLVQFRAALDRHGMRSAGFLGYVDINVPGHRISCCSLNGGCSRRGQLAYLLRVREDYMRECGACGCIKADHQKLVRDSANKLQMTSACNKCACERFV